MSRLLSHLSKLSSRNNVLMHKNIRLFSKSIPYLALGTLEESPLEGDGGSGVILWFNPAKETLTGTPIKTLAEELNHSTPIGTSHGWGFFSDLRNRTSVFISDHFKPCTSKSNTKIIPLPPLTTMLNEQTKLVWNVAMSSSSPEEEDCVVAIQFLGRQLSMCRPGRDLVWTNKLVPFAFWENSNLMYSKKDERFYLPAPGGKCLCSWDLNLESDPKFHELVFLNIPELLESEWERMDSYLREDHWVESPSGQSFLVKWYSPVPPESSKDPMIMVFREDDQDTREGTKNMCYTEDLGDLCIFLSKNDPFCVAASSCPGLKPNSIYLMGRCFAVYDLATKTTHHFEILSEGKPVELPSLPYWLPPFSS